MISDHQLKLLSLQICRQGVSIVEALSWNAFQMEGEVNDDMVDVIVQRRALFGQAYVQLRQAYPLLPESFHFQIVAIWSFQFLIIVILETEIEILWNCCSFVTLLLLHWLG